MRYRKACLKIARRSSGLTMVELMVVIAIVAILAMIGIPALRQLLLAGELNAAQENLGQTLRKARGYALTRGTLATVTVTAANRRAVLSLSDGSVANETLALPASVTVGADAAYVFSPSGTVTGAGTTVLTAAELPAASGTRRLTVSATGEIAAGGP